MHLTYVVKKKLVALMATIASLCCVVGLIGMSLTAKSTTDPSLGTKRFEPGPFAWPLVLAVILFLIMVAWYQAISKRRTMPYPRGE